MERWHYSVPSLIAPPSGYGDFTYVRTAEVWLYVAVVPDLYSRNAVGWSMSSGMTAQLVIDALMMALRRRGKSIQLMHHSDSKDVGDIRDPDPVSASTVNSRLSLLAKRIDGRPLIERGDLYPRTALILLACMILAARCLPHV